jgi:beta-phosphoglucomutase-like phosphatase (HAD superfamily)
MRVVAASPLPELVVVDFAGTTLHEDGAVLRAYRTALSDHGIPFTDDDLASRRGASKRAVFVELGARHER